MTVRPIECEELQEKLDGGEPIVLVDALPPMSFAHSHLPGAINLTPQEVDAAASRRLPDKHAEIVVYCANPDCESSTETAERLVALGYTNVRHYAGGKNEWRERGLPLERAGKPWPVDPGGRPL
jgi:rhodanese-related sulfurtransferase